MLLEAGESNLNGYAAHATQLLPAPLAELLMQCVAFAPNERPPSAAAALRLLNRNLDARA